MVILDEHFFLEIEVIGKLSNHVQLVKKEAEIIVLNDDGTAHIYLHDIFLTIVQKKIS